MESNGTEAGSGPATVSTAVVSPAGHTNYTDGEVRQLVAVLEEPTDRLNELFTVRGWTREYCVQTINNVERKMSNGTQIAGKVVVLRGRNWAMPAAR